MRHKTDISPATIIFDFRVLRLSDGYQSFDSNILISNGKAFGFN